MPLNSRYLRPNLGKVSALPPAHSPRNVFVFHPEGSFYFVDSNLIGTALENILFVGDSSSLIFVEYLPYVKHHFNYSTQHSYKVGTFIISNLKMKKQV